MFHASRALTAANAARYFEAEYRQGDYYTRGNSTAPGRWFGRAAADLGLHGDIRPDDFTALLEGRTPDGTPLVQAQQATGRRRAGWDFACSADKTVSIAALVFEDSRLIEAHDSAVRRALTELETFVQTRAKSGTEVQTTGRMATALFRHESSRALDPQLHTHVVIANLTRRDDGAWRAIYERDLFRAQRFVTAVYRAEMAQAIRRLGYRVEVRPSGEVGIGGFTREQIDTFSVRRAEVVAYADEHGRTTREVGQEAAHESRAEKATDVDPAALLARWRDAAANLRLDPAAWKAPDPARLTTRVAALFGRGEPAPMPAPMAAAEGVAHAIEHLAERQATFRVEEVERVALVHAAGRATLDDVRVALAARRDLTRAGRLVTTQGAVTTEQRILDLWRAGRSSGRPIAVDRLPARIEGEQRTAAEHILTSRDRVIGLEGKAGTGKSHVLGPVVEAFRAAGWHVRGLAPTTAAVEVLRERGIDAATVASFERRARSDDVIWGDIQRHTGARERVRQVWLVDEASLLSSRQALAILERAAKADAKVVLIGDREQHKSVEAGRPFAQLLDAGLSTARLERIQRQRDARLREAVEHAARGNAARAVLALHAQRQVIEVADRGERLRYVARAYMNRSGSRLVTTATNEDRRDVNAIIRQARIEAGEVEAASVSVEIVASKDLTAAQRKDARSYETGDHVTFRTGSRVVGVKAGQTARVLGPGTARNSVRMRLDDGRELTYDPRRLSGVTVGRIEAREIAIGDRIEFRAPDRERGLVNGALAEVVALDRERRTASVRLDGSERDITLDLARPQDLDHGYASTSYRSQGRTVDHVIDLQPSRVASRAGLYVGASRGRASITVVTDDRDALVRRLEREAGIEPSALDVAREAQRLTLHDLPLLLHDAGPER